MHTLKVRDLGLNSKMPFETVLTNAVPPGEITASGTFGPWQRRRPGRTPLDGRFIFDNADLGVFDGIGGTLSAEGHVRRHARSASPSTAKPTTPDFSIDISGHPVPLTTNYHAVVDATNGNTTLDPVNATFLKTSLMARGGVYEVPGVKGRVIKLDLAMDGGRLEDIMRLAVNTPTPADDRPSEPHDEVRHPARQSRRRQETEAGWPLHHRERPLHGCRRAKQDQRAQPPRARPGAGNR